METAIDIGKKIEPAKTSKTSNEVLSKTSILGNDDITPSFILNINRRKSDELMLVTNISENEVEYSAKVSILFLSGLFALINLSIYHEDVTSRLWLMLLGNTLGGIVPTQIKISEDTKMWKCCGYIHIAHNQVILPPLCSIVKLIKAINIIININII